MNKAFAKFLTPFTHFTADFTKFRIPDPSLINYLYGDGFVPVVGQSLHLMIDSRRPPFFCLGSRRPQYMQHSRGGLSAPPPCLTEDGEDDEAVTEATGAVAEQLAVSTT